MDGFVLCMPVSIVFVDMCINDTLHVCIVCLQVVVIYCFFLYLVFKHLSVKTKMAVHNACVISTLLYGSET